MCMYFPKSGGGGVKSNFYNFQYLKVGPPDAKKNRENTHISVFCFGNYTYGAKPIKFGKLHFWCCLTAKQQSLLMFYWRFYCKEKIYSKVPLLHNCSVHTSEEMPPRNLRDCFCAGWKPWIADQVPAFRKFLPPTEPGKPARLGGDRQRRYLLLINGHTHHCCLYRATS